MLRIVLAAANKLSLDCWIVLSKTVLNENVSFAFANKSRKIGSLVGEFFSVISIGSGSEKSPREKNY